MTESNTARWDIISCLKKLPYSALSTEENYSERGQVASCARAACDGCSREKGAVGGVRETSPWGKLSPTSLHLEVTQAGLHYSCYTTAVGATH
jgi:hypothetical protein